MEWLNIYVRYTYHKYYKIKLIYIDKESIVVSKCLRLTMIVLIEKFY